MGQKNKCAERRRAGRTLTNIVLPADLLPATDSAAIGGPSDSKGQKGRSSQRRRGALTLPNNVFLPAALIQPTAGTIGPLATTATVQELRDKNLPTVC